MVARRLRSLVAVLVAVVVGASGLGVLPAAAEDVAPTITLHPVSTTATSQQNVTLTALASPVTSVQWQERQPGAATWTTISGATSASYTAKYRGHREVRAVFSNGTATATTDVATVTYYEWPDVWTQPQPITKAPGVTATLSVGYVCPASTCPGLIVYWERSTDGGSTWSTLTGGTTGNPATYPFTPLAEGDGGLYRLVLNNGIGGTNRSNSALVTLGEAPAVAVAGTPVAPEGTVHTLTAAASKGYPAPTYQWQERPAGGSTWSDLPGETSSALTRTYTADLHDRSVRVVATNAFGSATSSSVTIKVGVLPTISADWPADIYGREGDEIALATTGTGEPTPVISWKYQLATIPGFTDPTRTFILGSGTGTAGTYEVTYSNRVGTAKRSVRVLLGRAGTISITPTAWSSSVGASRTLTATQPNVPYPATVPIWERSLDGGTTWEPLGVTSTTLTVTGAWELDGARYRAVTANEFGTAVSNMSTLTIIDNGSPRVTQQPTEQRPIYGDPATFTAAAAAAVSTPTVQWQRSDDGGTTWADIAGATEATYSFQPVPTDDSSRYRAVFTNQFGTATTNAALLRVGFPSATLVANQPYFQYNCCTTGPSFGPLQATYSVEGITGYPEPTIRWVTSWVQQCFQCPPTSGSGTSGTGTSFSPTQYGAGIPVTYSYRVEITNSIGTFTMGFTPLVAASPLVTTHPSSVTAAPGGEVTFSAAASGTPAPAVQWERSTVGSEVWEEVEGATSGSLTVSVPTDGPDPRYRARFTNPAGSVNTLAATLERDGSVPVVSASLSSASEPLGGAYGGPVTVSLAASDDRGVESITWSSTGAMVAGPSTVAGDSTEVVIDAVGTSTVNFTARDGSGNVSEPQPVAVTIVGAPAAPAGLRTIAGDGAIHFAWTAPAAASVVTSYRITPYLGTVAQPFRTFPAGTSASFDGLTNGVQYSSFRVAAVNAWGVGPVATSIAPIVGVPTHPSSLRATAGNGQALLTWLAPPVNGIGFTEYRITPYLGATALASTTVGPVTSATITGLENGSTYTFRIVTLSPFGESISVRFPDTTIGTLTHPSSLRTSSGNGLARLTWVAPPAMGITITGYRITPYLGATALASTTVCPVTSATITGLTNGSTYTFRIVTLWATGSSAFITFPATTIGVLSPPSTLRATAGDGQAQLTWVAPPFLGVSPTGYRITPFLGTAALSPTTVGPGTSATITGLTNGSTYTFRVVTLSANGTSNHAISAAVTIGVTTYPSQLRTTSGNSEARLLWNAPPSIGIEVTGYRITPYLGATALAPTTVGPVTSATITGLTNGATYTFRIVTLTEYGTSAHATFPATTIGVPTHASSLRAYPGDGQVRLTWLAPPSIGIEPTGYRITPYLGTTALDPVTVGPVLTTTITGLTNGAAYTFRIVTLSPHGESISVNFPAATIGAP